MKLAILTREMDVIATERDVSARWLCIIGAVLSCLLMYLICSSSDTGDTIRYAGDIISARTFRSQWTDIGHLLWRPWGYVGLRLLGKSEAIIFGDTPIQAVARFLIWTNAIFSVGTLVLMWQLFRRFAPLLLAALMTVAFFGANCFLNYSMIGSAYLPALFFEVLALWLLIPQYGQRMSGLERAAIAGLAFALSTALWLPYICAGLGVIAVIFFWPVGQMEKRDSPAFRAAAFIAVFSVTCLLLFGGGALASGVTNAAEFRNWVVQSENGWSQNRNLLRAITGLPRALYELGADTSVMKRYVFHDSNNSLPIVDLLGGLALKLAIFYGGCFAIAVILIREQTARWMALVLVAAAAPLFFFAIVLFEPSSLSRYLPLLPFFYLAAIVALRSWRQNRAATLAIAALLISAPLFNVRALTRQIDARLEAVRNRRASLLKNLKSPATVYVVAGDDFYWLPLTRPLDRTIAPDIYGLQFAVETGSVHTSGWRAQFARQILNDWNHGREVWISERLFRDKPAASWGWIEGDDPRVHWSDLPPFFRQFDTDLRSGADSEGFLRLSQDAKNETIIVAHARPESTSPKAAWIAASLTARTTSNP